jgi:hypothetical protein
MRAPIGTGQRVHFIDNEGVDIPEELRVWHAG